MTQRMFVCHAKSDIEATSEIVDALEAALELPNGTLVASSLPGYANDVRGEGDLHATLTGAALMLALFTERSTYDPEFVFELGAAWALGIDVVPLLLGATSAADVPWPLRDRPSLRAQDHTAWNQLVQQLAARLQVASRETAAPLVATETDEEPVTDQLERFKAPAKGSLPEPVTSSNNAFSVAFGDSFREDARAFDAEPTRENPVSMIAPVNSGDDEEQDEDSLEIPRAAPIPRDAFEPESDVRSSLPSYRMSLEAGRALSDVVFNREESVDYSELDGPFGRFVDAMGGSWEDLSKLEDCDVWLGATENLLQQLPDEGQRIVAWYEVGYELAILHNLAGQGLFDTEERHSEAERLWRRALERFLIRAENAQIPYEDLARVLGLLENLVGPRSERDLSNIGRSLDELRRQAAGADLQHTAA